ncbi:MAG: outer rane lipoprotein carrier protein [Verrucomicrobiota bacterium]|jgi:outer membrane lipoprotein carrier protein
MNKVYLAILLLLTHAIAAGAAPLTAGEIKALLAKIRDRRATAPHVQADFREERTIHFMNKPVVSTGKVWFQPPNKFRREVTGSSPSVTVSDGQQLWIYYPTFKSAEKYSLGKRSPADSAIAAINTALNLENVEKTFQITGSKIERGYELQLLPRTPSMKRMFQKFNVTIDDNLFVSRTEMWQPNGDRLVTTYSNPSRAPIPLSTFEFAPPTGTEVSTPLGR